MILYHATTMENKEKILKQGFKCCYGRFGYAVYFTMSIDDSLNYGDCIITANINGSIKWIDYMSLKDKYKDISFEEEEGIPQIRTDFNYDVIGIKYTDGTSEVCVYDSNIIQII